MLSDKLEQLSTLLSPVAPTGIGEEDEPPRFAFVRKGFTSAGPTSLGGASRTLGDRLYRVEARCWGTDADEADRLSLALETALRQVAGGRNYALVSAEYPAPEPEAVGVSCLVTFTLRLTTPVVKLEAGAPDDIKPTTTLDDVDVAKPAGTPGDLELEPGD